MPYFYSEAEVEVEVGEFLESCNPNEIKELIQYLKEDGHLNNNDISSDNSFHETFFDETINKLANSYLQMSLEDIETLKNIAKKY